MTQAPTASQFSSTQEAINAYRASGSRCYCTDHSFDPAATTAFIGEYCQNCQAKDTFDDLTKFSEAIEEEWAYADQMPAVVESDYRGWLEDDHYPLSAVNKDHFEELFLKFCEQWNGFFESATKGEVAA